MRSVLIFSVLIFSSVMFSDVYAHSMFNSAEKFESGFRVQVATTPEFPQINEISQFYIPIGMDEEEKIWVMEYTNGQWVLDDIQDGQLSLAFAKTKNIIPANIAPAS